MKQHKSLAIRIKKNYKKRKKAEILSTVYLKIPRPKLPTVMTSFLSSFNENLFNLVEMTFVQEKEKLEIKTIFFSSHCSKLTQNEVYFYIFMVS